MFPVQLWRVCETAVSGGFSFQGRQNIFFVSGRQTKMLFTLHVVRGFL